MSPIDHSAEDYCLREGHERALALAARSDRQRNAHLAAAARFGDLARGRAAPIDQDRLQPALSAE
jgi:hypothetical protein